MYRLLIVDDERIIVDGIYQLLQGAVHLELEIYRAYNAYEALEWLQRIRIDLIISDIRMPGMDGIDLQKRVMRLWARCKIIFLTGYNEFEYAQEAIRSGGAVDYLLKNQDQALIVRAVEKAIAEIERREEDKDRVLKAASKLQLAMPALQKKVLAELMEGVPPSLERLRQQFIQSEIPLAAEKPACLVVGRIDRWDDDVAESDRPLLIYGCQNIMDEYLSPAAVQVPVVFDNQYMLWTIQPSPGGATEDRQEEGDRSYSYLSDRIRSIVEAAQESCRKWLKLSVSFAIDSGPYAWTEIGLRYTYLKLLLGQKGGQEQQLLIQNDGMLEPLRQADKAYSGSNPLRGKLVLLEQYLENGQRELFMKLYHEIMEAENPGSQTELLERFYAVSLCLVSYSIRTGMFFGLTLNKHFPKMLRFDSHDGWAATVGFFAEIAEQMLKRSEEKAEDASSHIVESIDLFVNGNLDKDLSLTKLSEMVHHSPTYLSRLYKRLTGRTLFDYITEQRMTRAKSLLKEGAMKVHEIAAAVGYESAPHFTRSFKKYTGLTPQEFRDR
ncbi:response regulator [Cohnella nanjingensis]|uniref:Response regulator n=1 Tax=Cohnella nanjingensis TaxID=1387779 RepID=A0A7X0VDI7_9BACL|nr:response regulator [Cohnella nanjingensis]MBB6670015.1 response regulator [Cohnella nanjingensis]